MKKKVMLITMDKDEAIWILPSLIILPSAYNSKPSGVLCTNDDCIQTE
jgi:hypothetical protein